MEEKGIMYDFLVDKYDTDWVDKKKEELNAKIFK